MKLNNNIIQVDSTEIPALCNAYNCDCSSCKDVLKNTAHWTELKKNAHYKVHSNVRLGDRVIVQGKHTGVVRYIGDLDSSFTNDQIYIGVKMDDPGEYIHVQSANPLIVCLTVLTLYINSLYLISYIVVHIIVSESDGLFNGKRFFKCPPKHGLFAPINEVAYVSYSVLLQHCFNYMIIIINYTDSNTRKKLCKKTSWSSSYFITHSIE